MQRCGRCYHSCAEKGIQCFQCNKRYHEKCTVFTKTKIKEIIKRKQIYICGNKCFGSILPFSSISDRDFLKTNASKIKNPCGKCASACFPDWPLNACCRVCATWYHLKCKHVSKSDFDTAIYNRHEYYCSKKCELKILPFNMIKNEDEDIFDTIDYASNYLPSTEPVTLTNTLLTKNEKIDADSDVILEKCKYIDQNDLSEIVGGSNDFSDLVVYHANVVSLRKNINRMEDLFSECKTLPDVLGISETRIDDDSYLVNIKGYEFKGCDSPTAAGGAGLYIRENLHYDVRDDLSLDIEKCEDKWVEITVDSSSRHHKGKETIVIGIVYRHPGNNYKSFQEKLSSNIYELNHKNKNFMILGDVNINLMKYNLTTDITNYLNTVQSAGCISFIDQPTRVYMRGKRCETSCLDHIYSNINPNLIDPYIIESGISDHFSTMAKIKGIKHVDINKTQIYKRKQKLNDSEIVNLNIDLCAALQQYNSNSDTINVNEKTDFILKTYSTLIDKYMPLKKLTRKEKRYHFKPWYTKGIKISIRTENNLKRLSLREASEEATKRYKKYRNTLTRVKTLAYNLYHTYKIDENFHDKRQVWLTLNDIMRRKCSRGKQIEINSLLDENKKEHIKPLEIANTLNDHFNSIGGKMAKKVNPKNKRVKDPLDYINKSPFQSIYLFPSNVSEIIKIIREINTKKATGPDDIPGYVLKITSQTIAPELTLLFTECMTQGIFPDKLKIAKILPIHKGGAKNISTNYRPISLLPILGKVLEKVIASRFLKFINKHNILTQNQFGFRKNRSTELAIIEVYNNLLSNLENNKYTCAIFLDLAKAFDSVDHKILLRKLEKYGIRGNALELIRSYLQNRNHYVTIGNANSSNLILEYGVPQGSVLGPLLFLLFINDIPNCTKFDVTLFADDTFLKMESTSIGNLKKQANQEIRNVSNWLIANNLTLNMDKSKYMIIGNKKNTASVEFSLKMNEKN